MQVYYLFLQIQFICRLSLTSQEELCQLKSNVKYAWHNYDEIPDYGVKLLYNINVRLICTMRFVNHWKTIYRFKSYKQVVGMILQCLLRLVGLNYPCAALAKFWFVASMWSFWLLPE